MVFRSLGIKIYDFHDCIRKYLKTKHVSYLQHLKWNIEILFFLTRAILCSLVFLCTKSKKFKNHVLEDLKNSKLLLACQNNVHVHHPKEVANVIGGKIQRKFDFILPLNSTSEKEKKRNFFTRAFSHISLFLLIMQANVLSLLNTLVPLYFEDELLFVLNNALQHFCEYF